MRMMHLTLAVFVGFGLYACSSDDEKVEPVQVESGESAEVAPEGQEVPSNTENDEPFEPAELTVPAEGEAPQEGEGISTQESTPTSENDDAMYSEPPLPADDSVESAPIPYEEESGDMLAAIPIDEAATAGDEVQEQNLAPFSGGIVQSPGAKWNPNDTAAASTKAVTKVGTYTVRPGDTLVKISQKIYGTVRKYKQLADENGLQDPYLLFPGQTLSYSGTVETQTQNALDSSVSKPSSVTGDGTITVRAGDTLWHLAEKHLGSPYQWRHFVDWNPGILMDPNRIEPGMTLSFAKGKASIPATTKAAQQDLTTSNKPIKKSARKKKFPKSSGSMNFKVSAPKPSKSVGGEADDSVSKPTQKTGSIDSTKHNASAAGATKTNDIAPAAEEPPPLEDNFHEETPLPEDVYEEEEAE